MRSDGKIKKIVKSVSAEQTWHNNLVILYQLRQSSQDMRETYRTQALIELYELMRDAKRRKAFANDGSARCELAENTWAQLYISSEPSTKPFITVVSKVIKTGYGAPSIQRRHMSTSHLTVTIPEDFWVIEPKPRTKRKAKPAALVAA